MFWDMTYIYVIIAMLLLGLGAQALINLVYKRWNQVPISSRLTGAQAARQMLDGYGLYHVAIQKIEGRLSDHYDPRKNIVSLSAGVYDGYSVAATAIACHECAHAVQHARRYMPSLIRVGVVPIANLASRVWPVALIVGIIFSWFDMIFAAVILYAVVIVFQLIALPIEFNATRRAKAYFSVMNVSAQERNGASSVLRAAAFTYVSAALASLLHLLYLFGFLRRS